MNKLSFNPNNNSNNSAIAILQEIFSSLNPSNELKVKRHDLLSLSTKIRNNQGLLNKIRENESLRGLLQPEIWGKLFLREWKDSEISLEDFEKFWNTHRDESSFQGSSTRRDTYGSISSFASAGSDIMVKRKIIRALSVKSNNNNNNNNKSRTNVREGEEERKDDDIGFHKNSISFRVTVSTKMNHMPPQIITLDDKIFSSTFAFEKFKQKVCDRFRILKLDKITLYHNNLKAFVSSLEEIRDGDSLEIVQSTKNVNTSSTAIDTSSTKSGNSNRPPSLSSHAAFARRPSWKNYFDSKPLPKVIENKLKNILNKISLSSNRWNQPDSYECPDLKTLDRFILNSKEISQQLTIEGAFSAIERLGISYGLGKSHMRVLFDAIDEENTKTISKQHFHRLLVLWREAWFNHMEKLNKEMNQDPKNLFETSCFLKEKERILTGERPKSAMPKKFLADKRCEERNWNSNATANGMKTKVLSRPRSAPYIKKQTPTKTKFYSNEEDYLRELHKTGSNNNPTILLGYGTMLLNGVVKGQTLQLCPTLNGSEFSFASFFMTPEHNNDNRNNNKKEKDNLLEDQTRMSKLSKAKSILERGLKAVKNLRQGGIETEESLKDVHSKLYSKLAQVSTFLSEFSKARSYFHKAIKLSPSNPSILTKYGIFLHKLKDTVGAKEYFLQALVHDKECVDALLGYAILLSISSNMNDKVNAQNYFERAYQAAKTNKAPKQIRARVLAHIGIYQNSCQGEHQKAIKTLENAVELDPTFADVWFEIGRLKFAALNDVSNSVKAFEQAIKVDPSHTQSMVALAQILGNSISKSDVLRAKTLFSDALNYEPNNPRILISFAEYFVKVAKSDTKAENLFQRAFEQSFDDLKLQSICCFKWAQSYEYRASRQSGDISIRKKAILLYERAIRLTQKLHNNDEDNDDLHENSDYGIQTISSLDKKDLEKQIGNLFTSLGKCTLQCEEYKKSKQALENALKWDGENVDAKWLLALNELHFGKRARAGKLFRAAFEEDPTNGFVIVHFANFLIEYKGPSKQTKQMTIAENMLRKLLKKLDVNPDELFEESFKNSSIAHQQQQPVDYFDDCASIALTLLAKIYIQVGERKRDARILLETCCRMCPFAFEPRFLLANLLGEAFFRKRLCFYDDHHCQKTSEGVKLQDAIDHFQTCTDLCPVNAECPIKAASLLLQKANFVTSRGKRKSILEKAVNLTSIGVSRAKNENDSNMHAEGMFVCGIALERQGDFKLAKQHFRDAIRTKFHLLALFHLSVRKEKDNFDLEGAQADCLKALEYSPQTKQEKQDYTVLCDRIMHAYNEAERVFLKSEGDASGADPNAARALVMHQTLAKRVKQKL